MRQWQQASFGALCIEGFIIYSDVSWSNLIVEVLSNTKKIDLKILKPMFFKVLTNGHLVGLCKNFDLRKKQKTEISEIWPLSNWLVSHWLTYLMTSVGNAHTRKKIMKMLKTINHVLAPAWPTVTKPSRF